MATTDTAHGRPEANDTAVTTQSSLHEAARQYAEHDIAVFPCQVKGKLPILPRCEASYDAEGHKLTGRALAAHAAVCPEDGHGYLDATADLATIDRWWNDHPHANIGVAMGVNDLFTVDVDGPEGKAALARHEVEHGALDETYQVVTGRAEGSGRHHVYRQPDDGGPRIRNRQLDDHLETRGEGGYIVAPPSVHPSGRPYLAINKWSQIVDAPAWLIALARGETDNPQQAPIGTEHAGGLDTVAEKRLAGLAGRLAMMTADAGQHVNNNLNHAAYVAGQLIGAGRLGRARAEEALTTAALRAGLTPSETAGTLASGIDAGIANPDYDQPAVSPDLAPLTVISDPQTDGYDPENSWAPVDPTSYLNGTYTPPQPTQLARTDGTALFYPGRINLLFGESEAGKGWVALHAVAQALARGDQVLYIDFEDYPDTIYARLMLLGADRGALTNSFNYIRPDVALDDTGRAALGAAINAMAPDLVVLDGVTGAMSLHGLDTNSSTDVDQFYSLLGEPLARIGAAVVFIDHVTKSAETRGKGPIGSQHKRARVSGASYEVSTVAAIAPGRAGKLRLKIDKDRLGAVRSVHPTQAGEFRLDSTDAGRSHSQLDAPSAGDEPFRPTKAMEHVSRGLEDAGDQGLSVRGIDELGDFSKDTLKAAADQLVEEGYATREPGPRNALIHKFVRPFRAGPTVLDATTVPEPCPPSPTVPDSPGTVGGADTAPTVPASPPLYRRGTGDGREPDDENTRREVPL